MENEAWVNSKFTFKKKHTGKMIFVPKSGPFLHLNLKIPSKVLKVKGKVEFMLSYLLIALECVDQPLHTRKAFLLSQWAKASCVSILAKHYNHVKQKTFLCLSIVHSH